MIEKLLLLCLCYIRTYLIVLREYGLELIYLEKKLCNCDAILVIYILINEHELPYQATWVELNPLLPEFFFT